jgi:hypothetical protein
MHKLESDDKSYGSLLQSLFEVCGASQTETAHSREGYNIDS